MAKRKKRESDPLAGALLDLFRDWTVGDPIDTPEDIEKHFALARQTAARLRVDEDFGDELVAGDLPLFDWLEDVPFDIANAGRVEDALALTRELEGLGEEPSLYPRIRSLVLSEAGRHEEAIALARANVAAFASDPEAAFATAVVFRNADRLEDCEAQFGKALELAEADRDVEVALEAIDELLPMLRRRGEHKRAAELRKRRKELERIAEELDEGADDGDDEGWSDDDVEAFDSGTFDDEGVDEGVETVRRDAPKVGRNDPCPCGSGKKFKKCCGK